MKSIIKLLLAAIMMLVGTTNARAQSNSTKYTSAVAMSALQVGDTLAEGFSLTSNESNIIYFVANRHKSNENLSGSLESISLDWIQSIGANCVFSALVYNEVFTTFAPVDDNGRNGDAWVVTEIENIAGFTNITIAGIRIPGPPHTAQLAEGTVEAANWSLASGNASVQGTQVLENVMSGSPLTATYNGDLKVKSVIATKHLRPNDMPLTIEALTAGTIMVNNPQSGMKYTLNGGAKTAVTSAAINVSVGDKVAFYGNGTSITSYFGTTIGGTAEVKAYGNIMSLVDENGFATATTLTANAAFSYLFSEYANLKDISGLLLPATTLTESCYATMFYNCTGLTTVPSDLLPATTLASRCYQQMFSDCTGLTTVPSDLLPATTLASRCYVAMFGSCVNLTNVPTLPATTLAELCYNNMFLACTGLTTVPTDLLPATTMAYSCYSYMFLNCLNLTTAPALPATTLAEKCYMSMFSNCTGLTTVPSDLLPATTLAEQCYQQMFYDCENLAASPVLPATTLVNSCYSEMFKNCYNLSSVTCLATSGINQNNSTEYWLEHAGNVVQGTKTVNAASSANWPMNNDNGIPNGWTLVTPAHTPLTLEALTDGTIVVQDPKSGMQYTLNGGDKTPVTSDAINVSVGDKVAFYGNGTSITSYEGTKIYGGTADYNLYGNIMSLVDEVNFATAITLTSNYAFNRLFSGGQFNYNTSLKDASGLLLPATTLTNNCYKQMFYNCTGLTTVPSDLLPATTLTNDCYSGMFEGCTSLTTAPALPATTMKANCYSGMFDGCSSLTAAPALPATTLANSCYFNMFLDCTGLTAAPELPATTLDYYCYRQMFAGCTSLTTAPALPATTLKNYCYNGMFSGCTSLTTAPVLPATTLINYCYEEMFMNCSNLSSVTCLATNISATSCVSDWLLNTGSAVQGTKTFYKAASMNGWGTNIPSGWTVETAPNN